MPTAFVTGASSGIGEATAKHLASLGLTVYAGARRVERMEAELAPLGIRPIALDVTDDASMTAAVDRILAETGRIDALVNVAGYGSYGAVENVPLDEARHQFEVNLFGAARLIQLVLPSMRARGRGRIINISSIAGKIYEPMGAWYHATKYAVEGLQRLAAARARAVRHQGRHHRARADQERVGRHGDEEARRLLGRHPLRRAGEAAREPLPRGRPHSASRRARMWWRRRSGARSSARTRAPATRSGWRRSPSW